MVKSFVALIAVAATLLALAGPAAADPPEGGPPGQDPDGPPGNDPEGPPGPPEGGEPDEGSGGNSTADQTRTTANESIRTMSCPLVRSRLGDPSAPPSQLVIFDPNGCYNEFIKRALGIPPVSFVLDRL